MRRMRSGERRSDRLHVQEIDADVPAELELGEADVADVLEPERLPVEPLRTLHVCNRDRDEIGPFNDQPTEPSICSWIRRFISTAYSSGSSFVIGSTKPETMSAEASASDKPRDIK